MQKRRFPSELKKAKYIIEWFMVKHCGLQPFFVDSAGNKSEIIFEVIDYNELHEIAAFGGFPRRYPHYRWAVEFNQLSKGYSYGLQRIYEMVINNNPVYAYLLSANQLVDQKLVMAHVYAHADFFVNNVYFKNTNRKAVDMMANHAVKVEKFMDLYGRDVVEEWVDICLSLSNLIDINAPAILREKQKQRKDLENSNKKDEEEAEEWSGRFDAKDYMNKFVNPKERVKSYREAVEKRKRKKKDIEERKLIIPAEPIQDVMAFLITMAPLEKWQREVMEIVRREAYYFAPQAQTKIMNEGWATFWHRFAMTQGICRDSEIIDYADHASGTTATRRGRLNPYSLGNAMFEDIVVRWDNHRHGKVYEECEDQEILNNWEAFVAFKNIRESYQGDDLVCMNRWYEFLCFWRALKEGLFGIPKEFYNRDLLLRYWDYYQTLDERTKKLEAEIKAYIEESESLSQELIEIEEKKENGERKERLTSRREFVRYCIYHSQGIKKIFEALASIKEAFDKRELSAEPFDLPGNFAAHSDKYPGKLTIGQGLKKIFEVRSLYCDLTFIDDFLTPQLCVEAQLFQYKYNPEISVYQIASREFKKIKASLLDSLTNVGEPNIKIVNANFKKRGELLLKHHYFGRELDLKYLRATLENVYKCWQRPVHLETTVREQTRRFSFDGRQHKSEEISQDNR